MRLIKRKVTEAKLGKVKEHSPLITYRIVSTEIEGHSR